MSSWDSRRQEPGGAGGCQLLLGLLSGDPQPRSCPSPADVLLLEGVTLTQDARQLNGSERAVLDGLLTPAECGVLLQLAKVRRPVGGGTAATWGPSGTAVCPLALGLPPVLPSLPLQRGLCLPLPPCWGQVAFPLNLADMGWSFYRRILRETDRKNKIQSINASERVSVQVKIPWLAESSVIGSADMQAVSPSSHPLLDWVR